VKEPAAKLQRMFREEIPLASAMGVCVSGYDGSTLSLEAPLANNQNHKNTAFAGSLYSLAALAGWGLLHLKLQELDLHPDVVIYEGKALYHRPVTETLQARCGLPDEATFSHFLKTLARRGMARIPLEARIMTPSATAMTFSGIYAARN
jgi:thioesterase domain-containing protein